MLQSISRVSVASDLRHVRRRLGLAWLLYCTALHCITFVRVALRAAQPLQRLSQRDGLPENTATAPKPAPRAFTVVAELSSIHWQSGRRAGHLLRDAV